MLSTPIVDNGDNFTNNLQIYEMQVYIGVDNSVDNVDYIIIPRNYVTLCNLSVTLRTSCSWIVIFVTNLQTNKKE